MLSDDYQTSLALEKKQAELFETVCNPDLPENFVEALDNATEGEMKRLGELLRSGDEKAIGHYLLCVVEGYWIDRAETMAEDILEEEAEESRDYAACCYAAEHCVPGFL